jgi:hypothetical protein
MTALIEANVKPETAEKALTSIEKAISIGIKEARMEISTDQINPIEKDLYAIRSEIRFLNDTIKNSLDRMNSDINQRFERMNSEKNQRFENAHLEMNLRFDKMDQKMDFIRENLETQIKSNEKQLNFQKYLLWIILAVLVGSFLKPLLTNLY